MSRAWWEFDQDRRISYYKYQRVVHGTGALEAWQRTNQYHPDDWDLDAIDKKLNDMLDAIPDHKFPEKDEVNQ